MSELSLKLVDTGPSHHTTKTTNLNLNNELSDDDLLFDTDDSIDSQEIFFNNNLPEITSSKDTGIYTIYVDDCDSVISYGRFLPNFPSRHDIITATIDIFYPTTANENHTYKCINKITSVDLNHYLNEQDWSIFNTDDKIDANKGLAVLTDNLQNAINFLVPEKTLNPKKSLYPWIDDDIKLLIS